jgi:mRNA-degrading endonuclease RelE of RelBE toxin-antitoxin system
MYEVYEVRLHRAVDKAIAKLDRPVRARIKEEIVRLRNNPLLGYPLTGKHAGRRSLHLRAAGVEYRAVYEFDSAQQILWILYFGTRENFYKELDRFLKK